MGELCGKRRAALCSRKGGTEMSDIFLSYKREDRPRAKIVAETLEQHEYSVWWDRIIPPGRIFDEVIQEELDAAKCVVVLWSKESVKLKEGEWVRTEASEGNRRGILVPILIDDVTPPLAFKLKQAAKLIDWDGTLPNPDFDLLLNSVSEIVGRQPARGVEIKNPSINDLNLSAHKLYNDGKYSEEIDTLSKSAVVKKYPESSLRPSIQNLKYELQKTGLTKEEVNDLLNGIHHRSGISASLESVDKSLGINSIKKIERLFPYNYANVLLSIVQSLKSSGREIVSLYETPIGANIEARVHRGLLSNNVFLLFEIIEKDQSRIFVTGTSTIYGALIDPLGVGEKPLKEVFAAVEKYNDGLQVRIGEEKVMPDINRFCGACGKPIDVGEKFCGNCGANLSLT
jgi:hypothetical protein